MFSRNPSSCKGGRATQSARFCCQPWAVVLSQSWAALLPCHRPGTCTDYRLPPGIRAPPTLRARLPNLRPPLWVPLPCSRAPLPCSRAAALPPPACCALHACPGPARPAWGLHNIMKARAGPGGIERAWYGSLRWQAGRMESKASRQAPRATTPTLTVLVHPALQNFNNVVNLLHVPDRPTTNRLPSSTAWLACHPLTVLVHEAPQDVIVLLHVPIRPTTHWLPPRNHGCSTHSARPPGGAGS